MTLKERIAHGAPFRVGELAEYIGYSREQVYKWIEAKQIKTVRPPMSDQRIPVGEAERLAKILQIPGFTVDIVNIANTANGST